MTKMKEHHIMCAEDLVQDQSIRKTAACFGVDESTLRYRLERKRQQPLDGRSLQPEACAPHEEVISRWMSVQENLPPGKRPEPVKALYETLVSEYGYEGSYKAGWSGTCVGGQNNHRSGPSAEWKRPREPRRRSTGWRRWSM